MMVYLQPSVLSQIRPNPGPALFGLALAAAVLATPTAARAEPVSASYQVYVGGFHVLNAETLWDETPSGYRITAAAETQGLVGWLSPWKGITESEGRIAAGKVFPERYETRGVSDDGEKTVTLSYDSQGNIVETLLQPAQDDDDAGERYPLPADAGVGTLDPLSVVAGLSELLQAGGRCEGSFAVFDGRKRYDVTVSDAGLTQLAPTSYSVFAGEARRCRLDYRMLGGHRVKPNKYAATTGARLVYVGRPQPGAPMIPVRLEIETATGTIMGHLTGFTRDPQVAQKLAE
jgi:YD repeat-containing protein